MDKNLRKIIKIGQNEVELTHLDKIFWAEGQTKGDLLNYYEMITPFILPYLKDRPESLNRFPNGVNGEHFYQKNMLAKSLPSWAERIEVKSHDEMINYLLCQNMETLLYMVNLGCIEFNPWSSRRGKLDFPDYLVIDLDPLGVDFEKVIETALVVNRVLKRMKIEGYPKTSGKTGMHIYIPLGAKYDFDQARQFGQIIAELTHQLVPEITSLERLSQKRQGKVYLDFLQNRRGQTVAAPYSVRPVKDACVSAPLKWEEVKKGLSPRDFTMKNMLERLEKIGDIFGPVLGRGVDIEACLRRLSESQK